MATDGRADRVVPGERWTPAPDQENRNLDHLTRLLNVPGRDTATGPALAKETEEERQKRLQEAERRENEVVVPPQRRTDSLPPEDRAAGTESAAVNKFLNEGITRLDVIRSGEVASAGGSGNSNATVARGGSRAAETAGRTV